MDKQRLRGDYISRFQDGIEEQSGWGLRKKEQELESFKDFSDGEIAQLKLFLETHYPLAEHSAIGVNCYYPEGTDEIESMIPDTDYIELREQLSVLLSE